MNRTFVQSTQVRQKLWRGGVSDDELREMEGCIMRGAGVTVAGTGGLKKIRCGSSGKGKSGSLRVIFADYPRRGRTYLLAAFGKNEKANLSKADRNELMAVKRYLDKEVER